MTDQSLRLSLPFIMAAQAQKHVTHNEAIKLLDILTQLSVKSGPMTAPPPSFNEGDIFLVGDNATGIWENRTSQLAIAENGTFQYMTPKQGWRAYVVDDNTILVFDGESWRDLLPSFEETNNGVKSVSQEIDVTGGGTLINTGLIFPNRAIVLGVTSKTVETISGASSYNTGFTGETQKFGGFLGIHEGSENIGVIGPQAIYSDREVIITPNSPSANGFESGRILLTAHYLDFRTS